MDTHPSGTMTHQPHRYQEISFMKGLAIISIILCHIGELFSGINMTIFYIFTTGQMACQFFFLLSALSLCFSYARERKPFRSYIFQRFIRLATPYWGAIIITALLFLIGRWLDNGIYDSFAKNPMDIILNVFLLHGFSSSGINSVVFGGWFVGTLIIFYVAFPFLHKMGTKLQAKYKITQNMMGLVLLCLLIQVLVAILFTIFHMDCSPLTWAYFSFINQFTCFLMGFLLYELYISKKIYAVKKPTIFFFLLFSFALFVYVFGYFSNWRYTFVFVPLLFAYSYIFLYVAIKQKLDRQKNKSSRFVKLISKIGDRSYGIYLTHLFIIYNLFKPLLIYLHAELSLHPILCLIILILTAVPLCCNVGYFYDQLFEKLTRKL